MVSYMLIRDSVVDGDRYSWCRSSETITPPEAAFLFDKEILELYRHMEKQKPDKPTIVKLFGDLDANHVIVQILIPKGHEALFFETGDYVLLYYTIGKDGITGSLPVLKETIEPFPKKDLPAAGTAGYVKLLKDLFPLRFHPATQSMSDCVERKGDFPPSFNVDTILAGGALKSS